MKTTFLKTSCFILLVVVAFVYFANPIYAKASTADMDYIETDMTTSEVAELFAVPAAFIPAALVIIGFIVLTYCTLRNVQVPVSYSSQTSFLDKCTQLGQYVVDNATDPIKNFLYSVYTYAQDNNLTSITGIAAFTAVHIGMFFRAIALWLGGSLIQNRSQIADGLLSIFSSTIFTSFPSYDYSSDFEQVFNSYSGFTYSTSLGTFCGTNGSSSAFYKFFTISTTPSANNCLICSPSGIALYTIEDQSFTKVSNYYFHMYYFSYNTSGNFNTVPNRSSYSVQDLGNFYNQIDWAYSYNDPFGIDHNIFLTNLLATGFSIYQTESLLSVLTADQVESVVVRDVVTPWSDQIYQPSDDELEIDPDGIGEVLGGAIAGLTLGELINLLTQGKTLTLDSALDNQKIVGGGDYVFPSMEGIWKYPQYFFDMLKGWGSFFGGCLSAVTVGDGGLSWIFYGGFVLLICGGIIGKILLG